MDNQFLLACFDITPKSIKSAYQNNHDKSNPNNNSNNPHHESANKVEENSCFRLNLINSDNDLMSNNGSSHDISKIEETGGNSDDSSESFWHAKNDSSSSASDEDFMLCNSEDVHPIFNLSHSQSTLNLSEEPLNITSHDAEKFECSSRTLSRKNSKNKCNPDFATDTNNNDKISSEFLANMNQSSNLSSELKSITIQPTNFEDATLHPILRNSSFTFDNHAQNIEDDLKLMRVATGASRELSYNRDKIPCAISKTSITSKTTSDCIEHESVICYEPPYKDVNLPLSKESQVFQNIDNDLTTCAENFVEKMESNNLFSAASENSDELVTKTESVENTDLPLHKSYEQNVSEDYFLNSLPSECQQVRGIQTKKTDDISFEDIGSKTQHFSGCQAEGSVFYLQNDSKIPMNIDHENSANSLKEIFSAPTSCAITKTTFIENIEETKRLFQETEIHGNDIASNNFISRSRSVTISSHSNQNFKTKTSIISPGIDPVSHKPENSNLRFSKNPLNDSFCRVTDSFNFLEGPQSMNTNKCVDMKIGKFNSREDSLQVASFQNKPLQSSTPCFLKFSPNVEFIRKRKAWDFDMDFQIQESNSVFEMQSMKKISAYEGDTKYTLPKSGKRSITFSSDSEKIQLRKEKEDSSVYQKQDNNEILTNYRNRSTESKLNNAEFDLEEFVSASEDDSSSSDAFFETAEFYDAFDFEFSKMKNSYTQYSPDNLRSTSSDNCVNETSMKNTVENRYNSQTTSATENSSRPRSFVVDGPVIIKYIDEHTHQVEEMLIYPLDYFEHLFEKNGQKSMSEEEKLDKLIDESTVYNGKPVGIISNLRDILRSVKKTKSQDNKLNSNKSFLFAERSITNYSKEEKQAVVEKNKPTYPKKNMLPICTPDEIDKLGSVKNETVACNDKVLCCANVSKSYSISCPQRSNPYRVSTPTGYASNKQIKITSKCYSQSSMNSFVSCQGNSIQAVDNKIKYSNTHKSIFSFTHRNNNLRSRCSTSVQKLNVTTLKSNSYWKESPPSFKDSTLSLTFPSNLGTQKTVRNVHISKAPERDIAETRTNSKSSKLLFSSIDEQKERILKKTQNLNIRSERTADQNRSADRKLKYRSTKFLSSLEIGKCSCSRRKETYSFHEKPKQNSTISDKKKTNVEEIVSSDFRTFFSYYSKLGGRLKSGSVISKSNSNYWFKKTGVIYDDKSEKTAEISFDEVAR
ncbi:uncharacterized protein NPIL_701851 [Nephila pilipes]|uniref:Uncharacterized protein n=1 Tax=Nephila pilipes TaxID=299642 RepID=A0A8X6TSD7_NEPPI|nr:uncharacterized protein NPIL_701851 [Nephila pilipes]